MAAQAEKGEKLSPTTQRMCAWAGPVFGTVYFVGFGAIAGWIPPPSPAATAAQIADMYRHDQVHIRVGLIIAVWGAAGLLAWFTLISVQLKRVEGSSSPLAYIQFGAGVLAVMEFLVPALIWQVGTYRVERSDESIQLINDLGWFVFVASAPTTIVQGIVIGIAILQDSRSEPIFPRWAGYFNIWAVLLVAPGGIIVCFKTGPLAWNGVFGWWLVLVGYSLWIVVNTALLLQAIPHSNDRLAPHRKEPYPHSPE